MNLKNNPTKCIVLFSGGLDSVMAVHLLKSQGFDVIALYFVIPFESGVGREHRDIKKYAEYLGVSLMIVEEGDEFFDMVKNPKFGYGKHVNPCIDCRIHRLKKAYKIMKDLGAEFLATGEVIGQRPMSQKMPSLLSIEAESGLSQKLLRPLSALNLEPTIYEQEGIVDRSKLFGISGRSRKEQLDYAKKYGLKYASPAGGCLLTQGETTVRFKHLLNTENSNISDFKLLAYGRHFKISDKIRFIVGRNHSDNIAINNILSNKDICFKMKNCEGPLGTIRGEYTKDDFKACASILARYSKQRNDEFAEVVVTFNDEEIFYKVKPATPEYCDKLRM